MYYVPTPVALAIQFPYFHILSSSPLLILFSVSRVRIQIPKSCQLMYIVI